MIDKEAWCYAVFCTSYIYHMPTHTRKKLALNDRNCKVPEKSRSVLYFRETSRGDTTGLKAELHPAVVSKNCSVPEKSRCALHL